MRNRRRMRTSVSSRHTESAPPETHTRISWPGAKRSCVRAVCVTRSMTRATAGGRRSTDLSRDAGDPAIGIADLAVLRQVRGRGPHEVEAAHSDPLDDLLHESLTRVV